MPIYDFWTRGTLLCKWPQEIKIDLLSCQFSKSVNEYEFVVQTVIDASDDIEAKGSGIEKCIEATNLLEFLVSQEIFLNDKERNIRRKGREQQTDIGFSLTIRSNEELPAEKLNIVGRVQNIFTTSDPRLLSLITRAVNWFICARRVQTGMSDKYINFWIALEVLAQGSGNELPPKIKRRLRKLYPNADPVAMGETIGRLYGLRGEIVHLGNRQPEGIDERTCNIECVCEDLIRDNLGLEFLAKSKIIFPDRS